MIIAARVTRRLATLQHRDFTPIPGSTGSTCSKTSSTTAGRSAGSMSSPHWYAREPASERNHAIAVDRHLRYVLRGLPGGPQPLQVVVRDPPGPAARPSGVDRNLVLQGERDEFLKRRDADGQHALGHGLARKYRGIATE